MTPILLGDNMRDPNSTPLALCPFCGGEPQKIVSNGNVCCFHHYPPVELSYDDWQKRPMIEKNSYFLEISINTQLREDLSVLRSQYQVSQQALAQAIQRADHLTAELERERGLNKDLVELVSLTQHRYDRLDRFVSRLMDVMQKAIRAGSDRRKEREELRKELNSIRTEAPHV